MLDFTKIKISDMVIHRVGNKLRNEGITVSNNPFELKDNKIKELLLKYFLSPFVNVQTHKFYHDSDICLNELFAFTKKIFSNKSSFIEQSMNILKHLYNKSTHPRIKGGELYIVFFTNILFNNNNVDAIGLFKSENKDIYLKVNYDNTKFNLNYDNGININKLDKGCLIFNTSADDGYRLKLIDTTSKSNKDAKYWKDDFLHVIVVQDDNYLTLSYLSAFKNIIQNMVIKNNGDKIEEAILIDKSLDYFNNNKQFNLDKYTEFVFNELHQAEHFKSQLYNFKDVQNIINQDTFTISKEEVRNVKKKFKSIIKLDDSVEIKISNTDSLSNLIQKGYDNNKRMSYYKIFFTSEK